MEEVLKNLVLIFMIAGGILHLFSRLRLPGIVGLLSAGILIGPHGLAILTDRQQIATLAEIGVLLLMFSIGLDFTRERLRELLSASGLGSAQMLICIVLTTVVAAGLVDNLAEAVFLGMLTTHTSSALMLKLFLDRGELNTPPVRLGLGISITQDLSCVLMLLAVPMMVGGEIESAELAMLALRTLGLLAVAVMLSRWIIPLWMEHVIRSRSRELFLIFLIVVCLGTAWATLLAGLSVGLGAFIAGLAIAESGYSHHTLSEVAPFRDLLVSLFFISTGMLLDVPILREWLWIALLLLGFVIVVKFLSGLLPALLWGYPLLVSTIVGTAVAQLGEFAFILSHAGHQAGLMGDDHYSVFLLVAVAAMIVNPFLVGVSEPLANLLARVPGLKRFHSRPMTWQSEEPLPLKDHVIIGGYGLNGRNLATALRALQLPFAVLDMDATAVQAARRRGEPVYFGDCSRAEVLRKLHIGAARGLVLAISQPRATRQAVQIARHENPALQIIVRTRYQSEIDVLRELGASVVISEEFETSLEVLTLTLRLFDVGESSVDRIIEGFRSDAYRALRGDLPSMQRQRLLNLLSPAFDMETLELPEGAPASGRTLRELDLRARTGAMLLAIRREGVLRAVPDADFRLQQGDLLVLAGSGAEIAKAVRVLTGDPDAHTVPTPATPET